MRPGDLWIQDRNFCTCAFLCEIDRQGACFVTRQHEGLPFEPVNVLRSVGRIETGHVAEQRVQVRDAQGGTHLFRRIRVKLDQATRDGDKVLYILTNLPCARPRPNGWPGYIASAGPWRRHSSISKRTSIRKSIRWGIPRPPCSAFVWLWSPTTEFIPLSFWYAAPLTSRDSDRRHDPWRVYGSLPSSPARWSAWSARA